MSLAPASGRAAESDELFFKRFPHRRHRIRRAHRAEVEQHVIAKLAPLPKGSGWFTLIRKVTDDVWVRLIVANREDADTDISETMTISCSRSRRRRPPPNWKERSSPRTTRTAVVHEPGATAKGRE